jgi:lipid II isoglutaminyl synthase (glutamine-hydrolysing)
MKIRVGHLYPDYLNIYADRGNIAVLAARAAARGHELAVEAVTLGDPVPQADLFYIGGGQDREQRLVTPDLAAKAGALRDAVGAGAALLAVCGGYQLLGDYYRDRDGTELPGIGLLALHTVAGERRLIGDVLLDCGWAGETLAGFENHAGRTYLEAGVEPLGQVVAGFGNDGQSGFEGVRAGRVYGTYLHGPLLPRNPWFADRLLEDALAHLTGEEHALAPLPDELEAQAHAVSASRARRRGGRL